MSFQSQGGQETQNRRILQDLQQKRQMLLNQGQGGVGNVGQRSMGGAEASVPTVKVTHEAPVIRNPADMALSQRQALEHANTTSSGYFISQDSAYGNLILPVLPRFENGELKMI